MVSSQQLKFLLLPVLVAIAFGSDDVEHSLETQERNLEETDFSRLKREILETLRTERSPANIGETDFNRLKFEILKTLETERPPVVTNGGAVYTRWGRNVCPSGSDVVYNGVAGGSWHDSNGGGSNYLCLPLQPIWGAYNAGVEKGSKLYGSEYQYPKGFGLNNNNNLPLHDNNVPCVVCRSQTKTSVVMIPARNKCYNGWNTEYTGYLMSAASWHKRRADYVCVDGEPEVVPFGYRDENGALFYNVEGVCGSLPCPPYVARREITCAVCTK